MASPSELRDASFTEFVAARRDRLRRLAYAVCGDWHRAEDVVQTALVKLYLVWPRVRRVGTEDAYVHRIIVRAAVDDSRRPWRREQPHDELPDMPIGAVEPGDAELFEALQRLPAKQRAAVVLRHWYGLSVEETAEALKVSGGTVKTHTARGLAALRGRLQARWSDSGQELVLD